MSELLPSRLLKFVTAAPLPSDSEIDLGVHIIAGLGHINLRGNSESSEFSHSFERLVGLPLPQQANQFVEVDRKQVFWLGPNEWLLLIADAQLPQLTRDLRQSFTGLHATVTDLSGAGVVLQIQGAHAADILSKGCTLDLHPDHFKGGDCAQTGLAKANMLLACRTAGEDYTLVVRRTYAEYLLQWLLHSAQDCRVCVSVASSEQADAG
ncbi:MAG: sarcosine oxidase subunit gamma [Gammaproteobacteria bacterium]|jgi:sarcosine oxidase, subunit gamma|nr:sarcosine oxidase subunit gamma [Gammaproteobacteria bacterium]MBT5204297.1 sarcosine oxidase subunit gamma [Gammaproteobacteria bacterium]MBT5601845.1 sarcosine oxidase subunit gamma [Gammaproteobacteria bacterium]MBT6246116.1 sarcosine oxidase subunit gamma [Gammaproteobacteria bacterium]